MNLTNLLNKNLTIAHYLYPELLVHPSFVIHKIARLVATINSTGIK